MLKIALLLVASFSVTAALHINVTRTYFWLNKNPKENFYIHAWPLTGDDEGTYGSTNGSEQLYIQWKRELAHVPAEHLLPDFYLNYNDKFPTKYTGFGPCKDYNQYTAINLGQDFFNKILANYDRDGQCPIQKEKIIASPGNLQWDRSTSNDGVHCDTPVEVTLILILEVGHTTGSFLKYTTYTKHKIFEATYKGEFTDC